MNFEKTQKVEKAEIKNEQPSFVTKARDIFLKGAMGVTMMMGTESQAQENLVHDNTGGTKKEYTLPQKDSLYTPQNDWHYVQGSDTMYTHETEIPGIYEVYGLSGDKYEFMEYNKDKEGQGETTEHPIARQQKLEKKLQDLEKLLEEVKDPEAYADKMLKFQETPEFFKENSSKIIKIYDGLIKSFESNLTADHYSQEEKNKRKDAIFYWSKGLNFLKTATPEQVKEIINSDSVSREFVFIKEEFKKEIKNREEYVHQALVQHNGKHGESVALKYNGKSISEIVTLEQEIELIKKSLDLLSQ